MIKISPFGLKLFVFDNVYEPAEDSYLLAEEVKKVAKGKEVLDMGCGCGIQGIVAAKNGAKSITFADINEKAVENAKLNAKENNIEGRFVASDLFSNINERFDLIIFNPPYLPTTDKEKIKTDLNYAFDGGKDGRKIKNRFLREFKNYLKKDGFCLLIESSLSGIEGKIMKKIEMGGETIAVTFIK